MTLEPTVREAMLGAIPRLRAFALSLSGNGDRADDLVQETLTRAITNIDSFQPGTNMPAWLLTILRNLFLSDYRKRRREIDDGDGLYTKRLLSLPAQFHSVEFEELREALARLQPRQREAIILVGAAGLSYEEAAVVCECAIGTIKSRVNRARRQLAEYLNIEHPEDFGPDHIMRAVSVASSWL